MDKILIISDTRRYKNAGKNNQKSKDLLIPSALGRPPL